MNNIRIGNDIRLNLTLRGPQDYDQSNIKQIKCFLINEACGDFGCGGCCESGPCPIDRRFPREPFPQFYTPTRYTLHSCGKPQYYADPWNIKRHYSNFDMGFHNYHWWPEYHGFGIYPGHFVDPCHHHGCCHDDHRCCGGCDIIHGHRPMHKSMDIFRIAGNHHCPHHHCEPHCCGRDCTYHAPCLILEGKNRVSCYFPAQDQTMCGTYKLVVVLVVYEPGWGKSNLHTYTIDYGTVFNLVDDETGMSGDLTIDVDYNKIIGREVTKIVVTNPALTVNSNDTLIIGENDITGTLYEISTIVSDNVVKIYNPKDWQYDKLEFISDNEDVLTINENGKITTKEVEVDTTVKVTVRNSVNPDVMYEFYVLIKTNKTMVSEIKVFPAAQKIRKGESAKFTVWVRGNKLTGGFKIYTK